MNFWETITGSDLTREWKAFEARAAALPGDYRAAWEQIKVGLLPHGESVQEVLGDDIRGFCTALAGGEGARTYRDRWREQLNRNVARKLSRLGG